MALSHPGTLDDSASRYQACIKVGMRNVTLLCKKMHVHFNTYKKFLGVEKELAEQHKKLMEILETYEKSDDFYEIYNEICPIVENMHEVIVEKMF